MERENEESGGIGRPRLHRAGHLQSEGSSLSWEQFVRESLLQAAWPVALAPLPANSPRRANTLDQQSSASELIARRGVFSRRQYGSVEQLSQAGEGTAEADRSRRFRLENGNSLGEKDELFGPPSAPVLENPEFQTRWYFKYFLGKLHQNYIGLDASREPYLLSVVQEGGLLRAILFNKMGAHKISLGPSAWGAGPERTRPPPKHILSHFPPIDRLDKAPREVTCPEIQKDILLLEEQEGSVNFKIGIIYAKKGQKTDDEMLSNENGDENFDQFLSLLGERVRLKGWSRFRGGLDVKGDMTGSHAIYTMHQGHEVMFHVSTMLPFSKDNKQQLERKRHIGNDIVNIIFTEDPAHADFNPLCIKSHFTHIFAVVSTTDCGPEGPGYRLSVFSDDSVPPFGPSLPFPAIFTDPQLFREFLLVKLMNGEKATFQTPTFALKRQRTLDSLIKDIYAEHCSDHKVPMLSRRALSDVWSSSGSGGMGGASVAGAARSERFVRSGQALKLDAVLRGDAPTSLASAGVCGARRAPWEAALWRAAPLPAAAACAVALPDGRLLLSTTSNTYLLEESGTTRVVLRWEGCVRQARLAGGAALFRTVGRGAGLLALPLQELAAGAWAMRPHQDCKAQRLPRTKACHYIDTAELDDGRALVAVAIGRRILLLVQDIKRDNESSCDFTQFKDFQLSETPLLLRLLDGDAGMLVVGYKQHWEVLDRYTGQAIKRVESEGSSTGCARLAGSAGGTEEGTGRRGRGRGTLVTALRLGDERDAQLLFCFNHTCHFERLTTDGLQSDSEYNFHWTTVPTAVVCAFPYIMAFAEDLLEIRLVANGSLVHAACIPGLKLLCAEQDIFYLACVPEYAPLREPDFALYCSPAPTTTQLQEPGKSKQGPAQDDDDTASASSRSSSVSSEPDVRSPLQRLPQISPPNSPQVTSCHTDSSSSGRCVRIYKIPLCNLSAATYQRQSISTDGSNPFCSYRADKLLDSLNDLKLQSSRAKQARSSSSAMGGEITTN